MSLRQQLESLFIDKHISGVDMDALLADFELVRPFLRGAPVSIDSNNTLNEPRSKREISEVMSRAQYALEQLQKDDFAVKALQRVIQKSDGDVNDVAELRKRMGSICSGLETAQAWLAECYNPKGGGRQLYYRDLPYLIALFKEHVDAELTATPSGLFWEFVSLINYEILPDNEQKDLRAHIETALKDERNVVDLKTLREMPAPMRDEINKHAGPDRAMILVNHPKMTDWNAFTDTLDEFLESRT